MKDISFHYWLQGSIELGGLSFFSKEKVEMILKHIHVVEQKSAFIQWLEGFLSAQMEGVCEDKFLVLKEKLEKEFNNVSKDINLDFLKDLKTPSEFPHFPKRGCFCGSLGSETRLC